MMADRLLLALTASLDAFMLCVLIKSMTRMAFEEAIRVTAITLTAIAGINTVQYLRLIHPAFLIIPDYNSGAISSLLLSCA